ncbi:MAG: hypothetical protein ACOY3I_05790 [Verrucomicrobiota bacterium]
MKSKTLAMLVKLRQYQLEMEQWKLYHKQLEEQKARMDAENSAHLLQESYGDGLLPVQPSVAERASRFHHEAAVAYELSMRKLALTQQETYQQLLAVIYRQQRREMMSRLHQDAVRQEQMEYDYQERRFLDDLAQTSFARSEKEIL